MTDQFLGCEASAVTQKIKEIISDPFPGAQTFS